MATNSEEWLNQADYDMETAEFMFKGGRYIYTIFMCHLSIEKALNRLSVTTRYPDNLQKMLKDYSKEKTKDLILKSEEVLKWIKREFTKL
ncbi:MAG: HEPN domain-containing protein [bacterium]